jgi:hypothetical protein
MLKALRSQPKAIVQAVSKPRRTVTSWALWQQRRRWGDEASPFPQALSLSLCSALRRSAMSSQSRSTRLLLLQDPANANNHAFEPIQRG